MITPTVGRIVHYRNVDDPQDTPPLPAIITRVWGDSCVDLQVFGLPLDSQLQTSVRLVQPEHEKPVEGYGPYCEWMPYQVKGKETGSESGEKEAGTEEI